MTQKSNRLRTGSQPARLGAHRGHSAGAPENTLAAFRKARELGGRGTVCETDLALTRDGALILMHDETVDRTTDGKGLVSSMTYSQIAKLDAGQWFGPAFKGERVPLLRNALILAQELDLVIQLELKIYDKNDAILPLLRHLVDELGAAHLLQLSSFDFVQLKAAKELLPEVPTIGISHSRMIDPAALARQASLDAVSLEIQHFASGEALQLHREGFAANLYIPGPETLERLRLYGFDLETRIVQWVREGQVDQLLCDDVALAARILAKAVL
ncbi:hypothetical protein SCUCBS95973_006035 [Sporothrix curviconia]|uniref:GP-PDE domain-containing protein n=1 Tax=Sporothrix curviconia TaxID=1260050 RepID=A0ABP0C1R5_9PEZI